MFNVRFRIGLHRALVTALVATLLNPLLSSLPGFVESAFAGTFLDSWTHSAGTLTTSDATNGVRGSGYYTKRFTLSGVSDGSSIQLYLRARSGTVDGVTMGNYDAYLYVVNKTTNTAVYADDDSGTGNGSTYTNASNDSYLGAVIWNSNYEIQVTTFSAGVTGGFATARDPRRTTGPVRHQARDTDPGTPACARRPGRPWAPRRRTAPCRHRRPRRPCGTWPPAGTAPARQAPPDPAPPRTPWRPGSFRPGTASPSSPLTTEIHPSVSPASPWSKR